MFNLVRCFFLASIMKYHLFFSDVKFRKDSICSFILLKSSFRQSILIQIIVLIVRIAVRVILVVDFLAVALSQFS